MTSVQRFRDAAPDQARRAWVGNPGRVQPHRRAAARNRKPHRAAATAAILAATVYIALRVPGVGVWPASVSRTTPPKQAVNVPMTMQIRAGAPAASALAAPMTP